MIIPEKLKSNDEIRVLSPSSNFQRVGGMEGNRKAQERLRKDWRVWAIRSRLVRISTPPI